MLKLPNYGLDSPKSQCCNLACLVAVMLYNMQATFRNEAMLRQHEEGPAHKKALAREKAQKERDAWLENPSAASNALVCSCPGVLYHCVSSPSAWAM